MGSALQSEEARERGAGGETDPPARKPIAMFGLFRSGTNFVRTLLEWNFACAVRQNAYCWKHGFFPIISQRSEVSIKEMDLVYVTRNPFHAISSLHAYLVSNGSNIRAEKDFKAFIRNRIVIYDKGLAQSPEYRFASPIEYWNDLNWNLASIRRQEYTQLQIKYEEAMGDPAGLARKAGKILELKPLTDEIAVPQERVKNMPATNKTNRDFYVTKNTFDDSEFRQKTYMSKFTVEDIAFIVQRLDRDLLDTLDYRAEVDKLVKSTQG